jgi:DNA-binding beta-propeller fold protein YncE
MRVGRLEPKGIAAIGTAAAILALVGAPGRADAGERYRAVGQWGGTGTTAGKFDNPLGVAVDAAGNVYVADRNNHRVQKFGSTGRFARMWGGRGSGPGRFEHPNQIAVGAGGTVYVTDLQLHRVQMFSPGGRFRGQWGTPGSGKGQFDGPSGIATDARGNVYVADSANHRIQKFADDGRFLLQWGGRGAGRGELDSPAGIAASRSGSIYVADYGNARVQRFGPSGAYAAQWRGPEGDRLRTPHGIAIDRRGDVFVADVGRARLLEFAPGGRLLAGWGSRGSGLGQFAAPLGVAVGGGGDVYVTDAFDGEAGTFNDRVQRFARVRQRPRRARPQRRLTIPTVGRRAIFRGVCTLSTRCRARMTIVADGRVLVRGSYSIPRRSVRRVGLRLTRAGRRALSQQRRVRGRAILVDVRSGKRKTIPVTLRKRR